jgi:hypothetical protein
MPVSHLPDFLRDRSIHRQFQCQRSHHGHDRGLGEANATEGPSGDLADVVDIDEAIEMKDVHFHVGTFMPGWCDRIRQLPLPMPDRGDVREWQLSTSLRHAAQLLIFLQRAVAHHYAPCLGVSIHRIYEWLDHLKHDIGFYELSTETWRNMVDKALVQTALRTSSLVSLSEEMSRRFRRAQLSGMSSMSTCSSGHRKRALSPLPSPSTMSS